jgi:hypothetical protein
MTSRFVGHKGVRVNSESEADENCGHHCDARFATANHQGRLADWPVQYANVRHLPALAARHCFVRWLLERADPPLLCIAHAAFHYNSINRRLAWRARCG